MSTLVVRDIQGTSKYNNTVRIPANNNIETYGNVDLKLTMIIPVWQSNTRPSSVEVGLIGYNKATKKLEVWIGTEWGSF